MGRSDGGFGGYRGRRTLSDVLRLIAIGLAILVGLVLAALFFGQDYIVYTDDGARLDLPFFQGDAPSGQTDPLPEVRVEVTEPAASQPQPAPEPEPEPVPIMAAVLLSLVQVDDGAAAAAMTQAGGNAVVLDMKDDQGRLAWRVDDPMAAEAQVDGQLAARDQMLQLLAQEEEVYLVARFSCFKDHGLARNADYAIRTNSGYKWTDPEKLRWTSLTSAAVQDYLVRRLVELSELGFDEIVLDNCGWPTRGNLGYIKKGAAYDPANLTSPVETFLSKVAAALEGRETVLSIRCAPEVLTGEQGRAGLTPAMLETYAGRIWVDDPGDGTDLLALLAGAGITGGSDRLVTVGAALTEGAPVAQAALTLPSF